MKRKDKDIVTRNLNDTFQLEEDNYEDEEQLTPAEALVAAKTYLHCAQTGEKEEAHRNTARALKLMSDALAMSAPKKAPARQKKLIDPRQGETQVHLTTTTTATRREH